MNKYQLLFLMNKFTYYINHVMNNRINQTNINHFSH